MVCPARSRLRNFYYHTKPVPSKAEGEAIAILNHNLPTAYLVPADVYELLMDKLEDYELSKIIRERQAEKHLMIKKYLFLLLR